MSAHRPAGHDPLHRAPASSRCWPSCTSTATRSTRARSRPSWRARTSATGTSMSVHESQSKLWENHVARNRAFAPVMAAELAAAGVAVEPEALHAARRVACARRSSASRPTSSPTRCTSCMRFELERALIEGTLAVADLPAAWNDGMRRLLGVEVPDDAHGVLQDIHWAAGVLRLLPELRAGLPHRRAAVGAPGVGARPPGRRAAPRRRRADPRVARRARPSPRPAAGHRAPGEPSDGRRDRRRAVPALRQRGGLMQRTAPAVSGSLRSGRGSVCRPPRRSRSPSPSPGLTQEEIVQRARDMIPVLRERQEECERIGRLPDETSRDFVEAGFYRILQPRRFGGYEFDLPTFTRVAIALARGCPASGWTYTLTAGHAHMLAALWSEEGQIDIYGADGEVRMPGRFRPGTATPVGRRLPRLGHVGLRVGLRLGDAPGLRLHARRRRVGRRDGDRLHRRRRLRRLRDHRQLGRARAARHGLQARRRRGRLRPRAPHDRLDLQARRAARGGAHGARGPDLPRGRHRRAHLLGDRVGRHRHGVGRARPLRGEPAQAQDDGAAAHPDDRARPVPALLRRGLPVDRRRRVRAAAERLRLHGLVAARRRGRDRVHAGTSTAACSCASSTARSSPTTP